MSGTPIEDRFSGLPTGVYEWLNTMLLAHSLEYDAVSLEEWFHSLTIYQQKMFVDGFPNALDEDYQPTAEQTEAATELFFRPLARWASQWDKTPVRQLIPAKAYGQVNALIATNKLADNANSLEEWYESLSAYQQRVFVDGSKAKAGPLTEQAGELIVHPIEKWRAETTARIIFCH